MTLPSTGSTGDSSGAASTRVQERQARESMHTNILQPAQQEQRDSRARHRHAHTVQHLAPQESARGPPPSPRRWSDAWGRPHRAREHTIAIGERHARWHGASTPTARARPTPGRSWRPTTPPRGFRTGLHQSHDILSQYFFLLR